MKLVVLYIIFLINSPILAQSNFQLGISYTGGKIVKHTQKLFYNPPNYADALEINYIKKRNGNALWLKNYNHPATSVTFTILDYKDKYLGKAFSLMPTISFSIFKKNNFLLGVRLGGGVAYVTKYWRRIPYADSINNYLGSAINLYASVRLEGHYLLNKNWQADAAIALNHISNAGIKKPNFGINMLGATVGVNYLIQNINKARSIPLDSTVRGSNNVNNTLKSYKKFGFDVRVGGSIVEYGLGDGPLLPIYTGAVLGTFVFKQKHKLLLGIDYELNGKTLTFIRNTKQASNNEILDASYICAVVGNEFLFGNVSIPVQIGTYLNSAYLQSTKTYNKFGLFYYPYLHKKQYGRGMYVGTLLKTNAFNADFLELNVGYSF